MNITKIEGIELSVLTELIRKEFSASRFTFQVEENDLRHGFSLKTRNIKLATIRLTGSKLFCGNHPAACERVGEHATRKGRFLEGADWVEFNDRLNDVLDRAKVSAEVFSRPAELQGKLYVRRGLRRRINYSHDRNPRGFNVWVGYYEGDFENCVDKTLPPVSEFPEGTPGVYDKIGYAVVG